MSPQRALLAVAGKEIRENFRDRRSLFSALAFGPLFGPALFAVMISFMLTQVLADVDRELELVVVGAEHAPNLMAHLRRHNIAPTEAAGSVAEAREAVSSGRVAAVLVVPSDYGERFRRGEPARVQLVQDQSAQRGARHVARARAVLSAYNAEVRALRLQARGVSPLALQAVVIDDVDVSTPAGRALLMLGVLTYFLIFSMLMGGLYLAIDGTAGERERGSLEPLLTLPVGRGTLIIGKIAAACCFMLISLAVTTTAFTVALGFVPLERLGMSANFGPWVALSAFLLMAPFVVLGAALMTIVASFTKSYKEAQTYVSLLLLVPTVPIIFAALFSVQPTPALMAVPSLGQHLLVTALIRGDPLDAGLTAISVTSTLALGALACGVAALLYRREGLLG